MNWIVFALMTVACWGVYGPLLHEGRTRMGDPTHGGFKAFLFVGLAYFLTAVIAPLVVLVANGANWKMPVDGMSWSLFAGIAGAAGAFCALLGLGAAKGSPAVMSVIFAGAPIVNAFTAIAMHPPEGGMSSVKPQFLLGLVMALTGGFMVSFYRPLPAPPKKAHAPASSSTSTAAPAEHAAVKSVENEAKTP